MDRGSAKSDLEEHPEEEASSKEEILGKQPENGPQIIENAEEFGFPDGCWALPTWGRRGYALIMFTVLMAGIGAGIWLLVLLFKAYSLAKLKQQKTMDCTEKPPIPTAFKSVSFRINTRNFLLEVQVGAQPGWLLVCQEGWSPALGTQICRHLGHLRFSHHKVVNLTDIKVSNSQKYVQLFPRLGGRLEEMWKPRSSCALGQVIALKCSECGFQHLTFRIIGGAPAVLGRWPWQVSLFHGPQYSCGGSVLAPRWVVTAAHCMSSLSQMSSWKVFVGIVSHQDIVPHKGVMVEKVILHPHFRTGRQRQDYDIALLKLQTPLNFSHTVGAVCLPEIQQDFPQGSKCWVSGWGSTGAQALAADTLQNVLVPLISPQLCNSSCMYKGIITPQMLCAGYLDGHADACQGDSGGPLVCLDQGMWRLVGIVSWGWDCGKHRKPGVYTKVASHLDWIHDQIGGGESSTGTTAAVGESSSLWTPQA
ncbi:transmembrane protease serine 5 [Gracilinanus agilis]|uniref:transmembrane protease serine 5 n=1 Tax=Gracilinanus agilis TaxID=191870 RepID=UPI001CFD606A|nr:transmembrane protease serine 5 [Gracilinanus agilis]